MSLRIDAMLLCGLLVLFVVSTSAAGVSLQDGDKCVQFEGESGFARLEELTNFKENSTISMSVKVQNCERFSMTLRNDRDLNMTFESPETWRKHDGDYRDNSCNGFWQTGEDKVLLLKNINNNPYLS